MSGAVAMPKKSVLVPTLDAMPGACPDRRSFLRFPVPAGPAAAIVLLRDTGQRIPARLLDVSIAGARIQWEAQAAGPEEGEMLLLEQVPAELFGGTLQGRYAQLVWRRGVQAGLLFETLLA